VADVFARRREADRNLAVRKGRLIDEKRVLGGERERGGVLENERRRGEGDEGEGGMARALKIGDGGNVRKVIYKETA